MTKLNRPTFKQQHQDYIDRVAPFDTDPLIQKAENQTVIGENLADSVIFLDAEIQAINGPGATINLDFTSQDQFNIDTQASAESTFTVNLTGLSGNADGLVNIVKKSGDTFTFDGNPGSALFSAIPDTRGQSGKTEIRFRVKSYEPTAGDPTYVVEPLFDYSDVVLNGYPVGGDLNGNWPDLFLNANSVGSAEIATNAVGSSEIASNAVGNSEIAAGAVSYTEAQDSISRHNGSAGSNLNAMIDGGVYSILPGYLNLPPLSGLTFSFGNLTVTSGTLGGFDLVYQTIVYEVGD